nr:Lincosamide nucleotidyltransferase [Escherichia coli O25b:H4-ST131]
MENFDQRSWLNAVSVAAYFPTTSATTPHFENGIRGEFHFMRKSDIPSFPLGKAMGGFPRLRRLLCWTDQRLSGTQALWAVPDTEGAPLVEGLVLNLISLMLFGANL